ncbi:MAG: class I SAM-dependent methyltransferase, partial [Erysipelotrichia bacterium]|nr:class I SAM-dependent methyltransferase [Erysipelotrichia bacterium]
DECLHNLDDEKISFLFKMIFLITKKNIYINVLSHSLNKEHLENLLFQIGFRKHPLYYKINPYDSLNKDTYIHILMEKISNLDAQIDNSKTLENESLLHADMLRKHGRRSDGHCIRYFKASEFVRAGDSVLDLACGLGYGSHILYHSSLAKNIKGIDLCDDSITYANMYYSNENVNFEVGNAQAISQIADNSIDFITSFETIEHLPKPDKYLKELYRVLKPSGRLMISAPNDWSDETGKDPNPYHLHVYTLEKLKKECAKYFMIEKVYGQTAGGAMKCHHGTRSWREISPDIEQIDDEWIVLLCMKTPIDNEAVPYMETSWTIPNSSEFHVS